MSGRGAAHELPFALVAAGVIVGFALFQKHHPISGSVARMSRVSLNLGGDPR